VARGGEQQELNGGEAGPGRAGEMVCTGDRGEAGRGAEGVQRKKKGKRNQGLFCKTLKAQGSICKLKILTDLRTK
jgi:hypothetical protein